MKLINLTDIDGFFKVVSKCKGDVYITSPQGDRLNLKSNLTKYIGFSEILGNAKAEELGLELTEASDVKLFLDFMMYEG